MLTDWIFFIFMCLFVLPIVIYILFVGHYSLYWELFAVIGSIVQCILVSYFLYSKLNKFHKLIRDGIVFLYIFIWLLFFLSALMFA